MDRRERQAFLQRILRHVRAARPRPQSTAAARRSSPCVDDNFTLYRQYTIPQHAGFSATEENIAALRESLDKAYAKFKGTYEEPEEAEGEGGPGGGGPMTSVEFIADDTLEGLAAQLGLTREAADRRS